jgi:hypothetical protein
MGFPFIDLLARSAMLRGRGGLIVVQHLPPDQPSNAHCEMRDELPPILRCSARNVTNARTFGESWRLVGHSAANSPVSRMCPSRRWNQRAPVDLCRHCKRRQACDTCSVPPIHHLVASLRNPMATVDIVLVRRAQAERSGRGSPSIRHHPPEQPRHPCTKPTRAQMGLVALSKRAVRLLLWKTSSASSTSPATELDSP